MKRTKKRSMRLRLSHETIQLLQHTALRHAAGGGITDGADSCYPVECAIFSMEAQMC